MPTYPKNEVNSSKNPKRAVLRHEKSSDGVTPHSGDYLSNLATSATSAPKPFAVSEKTAALLYLFLEIDNIVDRVESTLSDIIEIDEYLQPFIEPIVEAKEVLLKRFIGDSIGCSLAVRSNTSNNIVNI